MTSPEPPIVLLEGSYQGIFGSLDELVRYVEAIDVRDGVYTVLDSVGRVIALSAAADNSPVRAEVTDEMSPERLERALRQVVAVNPGRWGVIDAEVGLDGLLRAIWAREVPQRPFPA